ncbi:NADP-dependent oxidoreductase [uncultured Lacinutrix sp.]|uniref:NADP-dependent oxidoreductase n=1 Tax=uncultured Lacinutrix sp. TaxID=574032 RepID=UPI00260D0CA6|nr:NADP-dependent oxidoreductase [uncultured Lacinutrix sp.]
MKTIILKETGGVENFFIKDTKIPVVNNNEVLIEVKAISINPVDYKVRANSDVLKMIFGGSKIIILGWDIAGVVVAVGNEVSEFKTGDRVFGMVNFPGMGNAYAEYLTAPKNHLAKIPSNISFEAAAATTLAALTALQVLEPRIKKGDRVLIHAGSGGVGHFAIQIAKWLGAYVITTSSSKNKNFVMSLRADEHIDYRAQAFQDVLTDVDFVFDMFNGDILLNSIKVVKNGGEIVSIPTPVFSNDVLNLAKERNIKVSNIMVQSNGKDMNTLKSLLEKGAIKPFISKTFVFEDIGKAHLQLESGRTVGKVVVTV